MGLDPKAAEAANPARAPQASPAELSTPAPADAAPADADRIELSDAARARADGAQDPVSEQASQLLRDWPSLDPERMEMILSRLEQGVYEAPESVKQVAERLYADLTEQPLDAQGPKP